MSDADINFEPDSFEPDSDEQFSKLLDAYHAALSSGTLSDFWSSQPCSQQMRERLIDIGSAITDVEFYFASTLNQAAFEVTRPLDLGRTIPGYAIECEIGQGSNGTVYLALDTRLNRKVAIKVPHRYLKDSPLLRRRFQREAELAAGVDHPHVLPIYEIGSFSTLENEAPNGPAGDEQVVEYIVSAYCPGPNLRQWLDQSSLSVNQSAELILRLSEGLESFHSRNILHRDIKPANIMLFPVQCGSLPFWPKLTDFGLAKDLEEVVELTINNECLGTPRYMALEQISRSKEGIGTSTDVYALGVVLYELLAGRPPFDADELPALFDQIRSSQPPALRTLGSRVPRDIELICMKCLQKNAAQRYSSALSLAEDLRRFLSGQPVLAQSDNNKKSVIEWSSLGMALILVIAITAGMLQLSQSLARRQAARPPSASAGIAPSLIDGFRFPSQRRRVFVGPLPDIPSGPFTIETWICPSYPRGMVLNFGGTLSLFSDDGLAWVGPSINLMLPNSPLVYMHAETTVKPEVWSHIASVYDGNLMTMYINGQKSKLQIYSEDADGQGRVIQQSELEPLRFENPSGIGKLSIGGNFPTSLEKHSYPFTGSIGDVRVSSGARYLEDFVPTRQLGVDENTLLLYRFESSTADSVVDQSNHSGPAVASEPSVAEPAD